MRIPQVSSLSFNAELLILIKFLGFHRIVDLPLQRGSDLEGSNRDCLTVLASATKQVHSEIAHYLLDKGADMEAKDRKGQTPLPWATKRGCTDVVNRLVARGANVKTFDDEVSKWLPMGCQARSQGDRGVAEEDRVYERQRRRQVA